MSLLGAFNKQWDAFVNSMEKMGKRIEDARKEYNTLTSTRRNQLERSLRQIEDLRQQREIPGPRLAEDEITIVENLEEN